MAIAVGALLDVADFSGSSYTPAWTSDATQPALNNGSLQGSYKLLEDTWVAVRGFLIPGSTSTFGTGVYRISLPYTCVADSAGSVVILDNGTTRYSASCLVMNGTAYVTFVVGSSNQVGPTIPMTWTTGDTLWFSIVYPRS